MGVARTFYDSDRMPELEAGDLVLNKLRVVRCLGQGASGVVYEVIHEVTTHRRALKVIHHDLAREPSLVQRFLREATVAAKIDSPFVTETIDAGRLPSGQPYLLMEYLDGQPLEELLQTRGALSPALAIEVARQVCRGLDAAHVAGIIHRDLKPENIFVVDGDPTAIKLLDFGIAKFTHQAVEQNATAQGALLGTPLYMSPEQFADGADVDRRTDLYSLGVVLYECLAGLHPYPSGTLAQLAARIMTEQPPPPTQYCETLPPALADVVMRALEKLPEDRYESATEMEEALAAVVVDDDTGTDTPADVGLDSAPETLRDTPEVASLEVSDTLVDSSGPPASASVVPPSRARWTWAAVAMTVTLVAAVVLVLAQWSSGDDGQPGSTSPTTVGDASAPEPRATTEGPVSTAPATTAPTATTTGEPSAGGASAAPSTTSPPATAAPRPVPRPRSPLPPPPSDIAPVTEFPE